MNTDITTQATLVAISFGLPRQSRELKKVAADAETAAKAAKGTVKSSMFYFKKNENGRDVDGLDKLKKFQSAWKREVELIAPYPYGGGFRILPAALVQRCVDTNAKFRKEMDDVWKAWANDDDGYCLWFDTAKERMGDFYDPKDFPSLGECKNRFTCEVIMTTVGTAEQWRRISAISPDLASTMEQHSNETIQAKVQQAMAQTWKDLLAPIQHLIHTLEKEADPIIKQSLVGNIIQIVELIPAFNLTGDSNLSAFATKAKEKLCAIDLKALKKDPDTKKNVLTVAKELVAEFEPFARKFA